MSGGDATALFFVFFSYYFICFILCQAVFFFCLFFPLSYYLFYTVSGGDATVFFFIIFFLLYYLFYTVSGGAKLDQLNLSIHVSLCLSICVCLSVCLSIYIVYIRLTGCHARPPRKCLLPTPLRPAPGPFFSRPYARGCAGELRVRAGGCNACCCYQQQQWRWQQQQQQQHQQRRGGHAHNCSLRGGLH